MSLTYRTLAGSNGGRRIQILHNGATVNEMRLPSDERAAIQLATAIQDLIGESVSAALTPPPPDLDLARAKRRHPAGRGLK